jgi:hypothetical protein
MGALGAAVQKEHFGLLGMTPVEIVQAHAIGLNISVRGQYGFGKLNTSGARRVE